jgi:hypothetical protein
MFVGRAFRRHRCGRDEQHRPSHCHHGIEPRRGPRRALVNGSYASIRRLANGHERATGEQQNDEVSGHAIDRRRRLRRVRHGSVRLASACR